MALTPDERRVLDRALILADKAATLFLKGRYVEASAAWLVASEFAASESGKWACIENAEYAASLAPASAGRPC